MKSALKWSLALWLLVMTAFAGAQSPATVLVVANANNAQSMALAKYYMKARHVPASNALALNWDARDNADTCTVAYYRTSIAAPIYAKIAALPHIDYILLCRNLPSKISETQGSVDSALAGATTDKRYSNYTWATTPFNSSIYRMYLVTRLDGWSWKDAFGLVDSALSARKDGLFVLDQDPSRGGSYKYYNTLMQSASAKLAKIGTPQLLDATNTFIDPQQPIGGYISWGSNDANFSAAAYNNLVFAPGAIAETLVSTSAMFLRTPPDISAQSQIGQLIHNGVTGVKGYVAEPYVDATANPNVLFPVYLAGRNLAEAFYSASYYVGWRDVVIGDPLCSPYAMGQQTMRAVSGSGQ